MRLRPSSLHAAALPLLALALATAGCTPRRPTLQTPGTTGPVTAFLVPHVELEDVLEEERNLAADSMQGRLTGTPGMYRAARYLSERFRHFGLEPAGNDGYLQHMPLAWSEPGGRGRVRLLDAWSDTLAVPADRRAMGVNVVGIIRGSDPDLRDQVVLFDAHYDHLGTTAMGMCRAAGADSVCNGADDDASGVVAVLEIARDFERGPRPRRTVVFLFVSGSRPRVSPEGRRSLDS